MAAIEPYYVGLAAFIIELLDHENMGIDTMLDMLAHLVLKIWTFFSYRLMAVTN